MKKIYNKVEKSHLIVTKKLYNNNIKDFLSPLDEQCKEKGGNMKKIIGKIMLLILAIILVVGIVLGGTGYTHYKEALEETPLEEKIAEIQSRKI